MKRFVIIAALILLIGCSFALAQKSAPNKITADLQEEMSQNNTFDELFRVIIVMNEQYDDQKSTRQMQFLNKDLKREYVVNELQQISNKGQKDLLIELQQGKKALLVDNIHTFWIFNGISCSMTKDMVYAIAERPDVKYVMKDFEIHIADGEASENKQHNRNVNQWNVTKVNADDVWAMGYTGTGIIVAVIDTGVNYNHTDIANNMWDGGSEYPYHGWDFINNDNNPIDDNGHGTHCAGTVSSYGTNGKQCGIAKDAKIMALKALDANGHGNSIYTIPAIEFAVSHGADIISMSLGGNNGGYWPYRIALENVLQCGVIASVSAGNEGNNLSTYPIPLNIGSPGNCPSPWRHPDQTLEGGHSAVVTVGATTSSDGHSSFSSYGPSTWATGNNIGYFNDYPWDNDDPTKIGLIKPDISAPGSNIVSLNYSTENEYTTMSGTSMAAPCVAGVMALMLQANPTLTPIEIDSIIETTAVACHGQISKDNTFGAGRIDALAAINYMLNVCAAPSNLVATVNEADVTLNWNPAENVTSYRIYRNGVMIAQTVSDTTFTDTNIPAGINTYFVRSNGENHKASMPSNQVTVEITTNAEINAPNSFSISEINTESSTVALQWNAPTPREDTLCFVSSKIGYNTISGMTTAAQRFPSPMLQPYAGMQIEHIFFSLADSAATCTLNLYEGDKMLPGTQVFEGSFTSTKARQQVDYHLSTPVAINPNKDLWLTITTSDKLAYNYYDGDISNACLFQLSGNSNWFSYDFGIAWAFQLGLSDMDYTYNVYRNNIAISSNQNETSFTDSYSNGMNKYQVTATTNNFESPTSNTLMIVNNSLVLENMSINNDDELIVLPNSTLTVTGTLSNTDPANLVLKNGAQLIHNSEGVKATVQKSIASHEGNPKKGWYFISSPVTEKITPNSSNGLLFNDYDLYFYEESTHMWRNHKEQIVNGENQNAASNFNVEHKKGYLYANADNITLKLPGTLNASTNDPTIDVYAASTDKLTGFNLVGNPFARELDINELALVTSNGTSPITGIYQISDNKVVASQATTIAPCEGFFIQAEESGTLHFNYNWANYGTANHSDLKIEVMTTTRDAALLDRAYVNFGEGKTLDKFVFDAEATKLYIPQNGKDYAIAFAEKQGEMPINFKANEDGNYTLMIVPENVELISLFLIDNLTGDVIDLLTTPSYTFEAKSNDYESRFRLLFVRKESEEITNNNSNFAFIFNDKLIIGSEGINIVQIIDINGRILKSNHNTSYINLGDLMPGVYVVRLIEGEKTKTQKIVIQ